MTRLAFGSWKLRAVLIILLMVPSGLIFSGFLEGNLKAASVTGAPFDYAVTILMENHGLGQIYGSSSAPYMTSLANTYGLSQHYTAIDHPSEPNYLAMFSGLAGDCGNGGGATGGCMTGGASSTSDCSTSSSCTMGSVVNLVDRLEGAGLTWSAYAEDLSGPCTGSNLYPTFSTVRHFPFFYFTDITGSATRCSHTHHATGASGGCSSSCDPELIAELNSTNPANYIWLTPNDCDNMHSCSVTIGDNYLKTLVPAILGTTLFKTQKAALFIVFDEGNASYPSDYVYAVWAGPAAKTAFKSTNPYTHYSYLKTFESVWGLPSLQTTDSGAVAMTEFFGPSTPGALTVSFTWSPTSPTAGQSVSFTATATGGTAPYTYAWAFGDSATGTGATPTHTYANAGTYTVSVTVTDNVGGSNVASNSVIVGSSPPAHPPIVPTKQYWASFYYPWYGNNPWRHWNDMNHNPPTTWASMYLPDDGSGVYDPSAELYSSTSTITMNRHLSWLDYSGSDFALVSWWGQGSYEDNALGSLLKQAASNSSLHVRLAIYYEPEGISDPTVSQIVSDLTYIYDNRSNSSAYFKVADGTGIYPVVFVYGGPTDGASYASRWSQARDQMYAIGKPVFIALKVFTGFGNYSTLVDSWHQYAPSTRYELQSGYSAFVSPGYWEYPELAAARGHSTTSPLLPRNATAFQEAIATMAGLSLTQATFLLVETFNEFHEGSQVEPAFLINHMETGFTQASPSYASTFLSMIRSRGVGNIQPTLTVPGSQTVNEGTLLTFPISASDLDSPSQTLTLSASSLPSGALFPIMTGVGSVGGTFSWTPSSGQAGNYTVGFTVKDSGTPQLSNYKTVAIAVYPKGSTPPVLSPIGSKTINELSLLTFTATATDPNATDTLRFSLGSGAPAGASITSTGVFAWTPTEAQGPGSYFLTIIVTDNGSPPASDSETMTITVNEVNSAPVLTVPGAQAINEGTLLTFSISATDPDIPANTIAFSASGLPTGASFSSSTRTFSWTPSEAQGPGDYTVIFKATDNGTPTLSSSKSVAIHVNEVNSPPVLTVPGAQTASAGSLVAFTIAATDPDIPINKMTFSATGLLSGATLDPTTGKFSWTPSSNQLGTYTLTFTATDNGSPPLSDSKTVALQVSSVVSGPGRECPICVVIIRIPLLWLLAMGGTFGLMISMAVLSLRQRSRLQRARKRFAYR